MTRRAKGLLFVAGASVFGVVASGFILLSASVVTVENQSGEDLTDVALVLRSGSYSFGSLKNGEKRTLQVRRHGQAGVELYFMDEGKRTVAWKGGALEPDGRHMHLKVGKAGEVTEVTERVLLPGLLRSR